MCMRCVHLFASADSCARRNSLEKNLISKNKIHLLPILLMPDYYLVYMRSLFLLSSRTDTHALNQHEQAATHTLAENGLVFVPVCVKSKQANAHCGVDSQRCSLLARSHLANSNRKGCCSSSPLHTRL